MSLRHFPIDKVFTEEKTAHDEARNALIHQGAIIFDFDNKIFNAEKFYTHETKKWFTPPYKAKYSETFSGSKRKTLTMHEDHINLLLPFYPHFKTLIDGILHARKAAAKILNKKSTEQLVLKFSKYTSQPYLKYQLSFHTDRNYVAIPKASSEGLVMKRLDTGETESLHVDENQVAILAPGILHAVENIRDRVSIIVEFCLVGEKE